MRKRLNVEGGSAWLLDAEGNRVAKLHTVTIEFVEDMDGHPPPPQTAIPGADTLDAPRQVWDHYVAVMRPRNGGFDQQARAVIREALKVATIDECKRAINGCAASSFHMGQNDRGKKYNRISHILKGKRGTRTTREQIDLFLDIAEKAGSGGSVPSADSARINEAKRDVLTAHEFPGDEHAVRRGGEAQQWLETNGWKISRADDGWPMFQPPQ